MTVCRFYLQGRCRYGDRCWNEHTNPSPSPQRRDNYSWVSQSASSHGNYSSTAQFSKGNYSSSYRESGPRYDYGYDFDYNYNSRGSSPTRNQYSDRYGPSSTGHQYNRPASESYERTFAPNRNAPFQLKTSNRFSVVNNVGDTGKNAKDNSITLIIKDEVTDWENSHMWPFSCCSHFKYHGMCMPGFVDVSPEELRHVAYEAEKNGIFPTYVETVAAALGEIKKKWSALKNPTPEILQSIQNGYCVIPDFCEENLKKLILTPQTVTVSPYDGGQHSGGVFPQVQAENAAPGQFSFKLASESLGSSSAFQSVSPSGKDERLSSFGAPSSGFGFASSAFASSSVSPAPFGFGSSGESHFPSTKPPGDSSDAQSCAYTQLQNLNDDEKAQFSSQTFTLGKIPSRPPPVEMCF